VEAQNPVQIHLGLQEQARVKWTPRMHLDSVLGHPPIHGKLIERSTCSPNMGPFGTNLGAGAPMLAPLWPIFLQKALADTLWSVQRCVGAINVLKDSCVVGLGHSREEYSVAHFPSPLL
jgi:hypothetical protein